MFKQDAKAAPGIHSKNSHASPTPVVEGGKLYVHFGHMGTACLTTDGKVVWRNTRTEVLPGPRQRRLAVLVDDMLVFSIDGSDKQFVVALDTTRARSRWKTPRESKPSSTFSFSTPLLITVDGKEQIISPGQRRGDGATTRRRARKSGGCSYNGYSVVPRPVFGHGLVYLCTGYDSPMLLRDQAGRQGRRDRHARRLDGEEGVPHNASPLLVGDALYMVSDDGLADVAWTRRPGSGAVERADRGRRTRRRRCTPAGWSTCWTRTGTATVFKPGASYDAVATNKMGEKALASYGVDGNALFCAPRRRCTGSRRSNFPASGASLASPVFSNYRRADASSRFEEFPMRWILTMTAFTLSTASAVARPNRRRTSSRPTARRSRTGCSEPPTPGEKYPLVLFLHGAGERGTDNKKQLVWFWNDKKPSLMTRPEVAAAKAFVDRAAVPGGEAVRRGAVGEGAATSRPRSASR